MTPEKFLAYVRKQNEVHPIAATRGLDISSIEPGQLHRSFNSEDFPEVFYFIMRQLEDEHYLVIPGSLHAYMAGNNDIILPKNIMGNYIFLSLDLAKVLPASSIANGFAKLDQLTVAQVEVAYEYYKVGKTGPYPFGMAYGSENDPMAQYHEQIRDIVNKSGDLKRTLRCYFEESLMLFKKAMLFSSPAAAFAARDIGISVKKRLPFMINEEEKPAVKQKKSVRCCIQGYDDSIFYVEFCPEEGVLQIFCQNSDGKEIYCFDTWLIADESGTICGEVRNGKAEISVSKEWNGALCLIDNKQRIHVLIPE